MKIVLKKLFMGNLLNVRAIHYSTKKKKLCVKQKLTRAKTVKRNAVVLITVNLATKFQVPKYACHASKDTTCSKVNALKFRQTT